MHVFINTLFNNSTLAATKALSKFIAVFGVSILMIVNTAYAVNASTSENTSEATANTQSVAEQLEQALISNTGANTVANPAATSANDTSAQTAALSQTATASSTPITLDDTQNLSAQIETLKQAMVNLNRDLFILEEDLLFPSSTQMAVYLAMDVGEYFALDAVEIRLDGEVQTYYLYTDRQVNALYRGGVQRLYVGNVSQGKHTLSAYFVGVGPQNREYKRAVSIEFEKDEDPVAIELNVIDSTNKQQPVFEASVL
jgi:hypothetical protein